MLILTETTDNLQVVLAGAITTNQLPCYATWRDITTSAYTPGRSATNTNSTTDVNLVAAPAASTQRVIDFISVYNNDTVSATVTIKLDANGTEYILQKVALGTGERLEYAEGVGFKVIGSNGAVKTALANGSNVVASGLSMVTIDADVTNNNATLNTIQDVTGLSFAVTSGQRYYFYFSIHYTAAATTTGSRWSINGPGSPTELRYTSCYSLTATTQTTNHGLSAYDTPAASNATSAATGSNIATIKGFIMPSADGTVIARFASEIANSAIVAKRGSTVQWAAVG